MTNKKLKQTDSAVVSIKKFTDLYRNGNVILCEDIKQIPLISHDTNMVQFKYNTFILCEKGYLSGRTRTCKIELMPGDILFAFTNMTIEYDYISKDFSAKIVCLSSQLCESIFYTSAELIEQFYYVVFHPQKHPDDNDIETIRHYYSLFKLKLTKPFNKSDAYSFICLSHAFVCDALAIMASNKSIDNAVLGKISRGQILFKNFIKTLATTYPRERSLQYYSDRLCVTTKYLSTTVKSISGRTAHQWIDEYITEDIVRLLNHSDKSIKEIAGLLGFENLSFFGKYVKKKLGVSPMHFRHKNAE